MQELSLNFPTVVILLVILALAVLAIRRMTRRGLCDCGDHCGDGEGGCAGCSHCASAVRPTVSSRINGTVPVTRCRRAARQPRLWPKPPPRPWGIRPRAVRNRLAKTM